MTESTPHKLRKPFRGRRPRRPAQANAQEQLAGDAPVAAGGSDDPSGAPASETGGPPADAAAIGADGQRGPRPPRPPRPNRQGRPPGQGGQGQPGGQRGGRPDGQGGSDVDPPPRFDGRPPRPNDAKSGKSRADRGQGGRGPQGQGARARGGQGGGQPHWVGRPNAAPQPPFGGNDHRRSRGAGGPQFDEPVRLVALLSERGLCSPREADSFIERGWVIVNGERVSSPGLRVHPAAEIRLAPEARGEQSRQVTILLNKPVDCIAVESAGDAPVDAESGFELARTLIAPTTLDDRYDGPSFQPSHLQGLSVAGNLDVDAMGLLVLTQDEHVLRQLGSGEATIEMEYLVDVDGTPDDDALDSLGRGVEVDGVTLAPARVGRQGENQLKVVLTGGQDSLYRLCEQAGLTVTGVKRVRIGQVRLGDLPQGKWRYLRDDENF